MADRDRVMAAALGAVTGTIFAALAFCTGAGAAAAKPRAALTWTKADIVVAKARCAKLLRGLDVVVEPMAPLRRNACGSPAPMALISVGSNPKVSLKPAPTVNCTLVAAVHKWLKRDLQPMARRHLGAPVATIDVMSSYSCRNVYGRKNGRLSDHAKANALDIRGFITTKGEIVTVLTDWGPTARKLRAMARAARRRPSRKLPSRPSLLKRRAKALIATGSVKPRNNLLLRRRRATFSTRPLLRGGKSSQAGLRGSIGGVRLKRSLLPQPSRLGASGANKKTRGAPLAAWRKSVFLRAVHKRACSIFGTILGPEANHAHRHHFHVDMARRKSGSYCR